MKPMENIDHSKKYDNMYEKYHQRKKKKNGQRFRKASVADPLLAEKACIVEVNFTRATASCDAIFCRTTLALWFSSELEDAK